MNETPATAHNTQPDWDMTPYFPQLGRQEYQTFRHALTADIATLKRDAASVARLDTTPLSTWSGLLQHLETGGRSLPWR